MFSLAELECAARLINSHFPGTPQYAWPLLAERAGAELWVKHENHTPIGAFKVRGGLVYAERLRRERPWGPGHRLRHARQPRPVSRPGLSPLWPSRDGRRSTRQ